MNSEHPATNSLDGQGLHPVRDASVWKGVQFTHDRSWRDELTDDQANALVDAARRWDGRDFRSLGCNEAAVSLEALLPTVNTLTAELGSRGFVLLRGVPIDALTADQVKLAY